jgi:predicted nucleic acid-binding protein
MKKLFIDTNIVLDLLAKREPFFEDAAKLFSLADKKKVKLLVSSLTFANTNYVLSKLNNPISARDVLSRFKVLVTVVDLNDKILTFALGHPKIRIRTIFAPFAALRLRLAHD